MADKKLTELVQLTADQLAADDVLLVADVTAASSKKITSKDLVQKGVSLIDDGAIPIDKIDTSTLSPEVPDNSITGAKLADNSTNVVDTALPAAGEYVGQLATIDSKIYVWDGSSWIDAKAAGSINEILPDTTGPILIGVGQTDDTVQLTGYIEPAAGPREFLAGPTASGGDVVLRQIVGDDLPDATETTKGAVVVPADSGLAVNTGAISIDNTVVPNTADTPHIVVYDSHGLVIGGREIAGGDLPVADGNAPGAVSAGTGLTVDVDGVLNHTNSITPGTGTKVSFDGQGHITGTQPLLASDLPTDIPADNISGGTGGLDVSTVIPDRSIEEIKLADYSTCQMQEANPGSGYKLGHLWWQPSTAQLRIFARGSGPENVWRPVGFGALQANNLRWGGIIDANLSTIVTVTNIGASENLTAGQAIPAPSDTLSGMYFITQVEGNNISQPNVGGITFTPGDWLLCINDAEGYVHIDAGTAGGGGGGSNVNYLDDLLDVELGPLQQGPFGIPTIDLADGQMLMYDGDSGMWRNYDVVDGGTF